MKGAWQLLRHDTTRRDGLYTRQGGGKGSGWGLGIWHLASWNIHGWLTIFWFSYWRAVLVRRGGRQDADVTTAEDASCGLLGRARDQTFKDQTPSFIIEKTTLKVCHMKNAYLYSNVWPKYTSRAFAGRLGYRGSRSATCCERQSTTMMRGFQGYSIISTFSHSVHLV